MSIDVVVVLPCVPATAIERAIAQIDASIPARRSVGMPIDGRVGELDVVGRDRRRRGDGVASLDVGPVVADVHRHTGGPHAIEHRLFAKVAPGHPVAHLGERDGDRRHARTADADDVQPLRAGQIQRGLRGWATLRVDTSSRCLRG